MTRPPVRKDTFISQNRQMLGKIGLGDSQFLGQGAHALLSLRQDLKNLDPYRMAQHPKTSRPFQDPFLRKHTFTVHNIMIFEY